MFRTLAKRRYVVLPLLVIVCAGTASYFFFFRTSSNRDPSTTLRIAYRQNTMGDPTPVILAETNAKGKQVRIELVPASSPQDAMTKLETGEADAAAGLPLDVFFSDLAAAGDKEPKYRAYQISVETPGSHWLGIAVMGNVPVETVKDLAGRPVGILPVRQADFYIKRILTAAGVPKDQIVLRQFNPLAAATGLRTGQFICIYGPEPWMALTVSEGGKILAGGPTSTYLYGGKPLPAIGSVISTEFKEKHPDAYAEFLEMMKTARELTKTEPDRVRSFYQKPAYGGLAENVCRHLAFPEMREPDAELRTVAEMMMTDFVRDGLLPRSVDLSPLFPNK